jgi:hypothetical protein
MRAGWSAVVLLWVALLGGCDSRALGTRTEDPPPPKPTGPPVYAATLVLTVDARGVVAGTDEIFGEAALDPEAAAGFARFVAGARAALDGRMPGHIGLHAARLEAITPMLDAASATDGAQLRLALALGIVTEGSQDVYPVADSAGAAIVGALTSQWDPGDITAADWQDVFAGRFAAVVWGGRTADGPGESIPDLSKGLVRLRFALDLEAYADPLPSGRRFGNPHATLCAPGSTETMCGGPPGPAPWDRDCDDAARDDCANVARCCPGGRIDEGRCRDSHFWACTANARAQISSGFTFDDQAAQICRAARRKLGNACSVERGATLADALDGLQCDHIFKNPRHGVHDRCGVGWCDDPGPGFRATCIPRGDAPPVCGQIRIAEPGRPCGLDAQNDFVHCADPYVCDSHGVCAFGGALGEACTNPSDCWSGLCEQGRCAAGPALIDQQQCEWEDKAAIAVSHAPARDLAVDAGRLFMALDQSAGVDLAAMPAEGGRPVSLLRLQGVRGLAPFPDRDHVYFSAQGRALGLYRVPKAGGAIDLARLPVTVREDFRFVASGDDVFTADGRCTFLGRGHLAGGPFTVTLNRAALATAGPITNAAQLAVDDRFVYCAANRRLWRAPRAGGPAELVDTLVGTVGYLAAGASQIVYTLNDAGGMLVARAADGGAPRVLVRAGQRLDGHIHIDPGRQTVYFMGLDGQLRQEIQAVALADGKVSVVTDAAGAAEELVGDEGFLYYSGAYGITRIAK